jgi:hypothetical protein
MQRNNYKQNADDIETCKVNINFNPNPDPEAFSVVTHIMTCHDAKKRLRKNPEGRASFLLFTESRHSGKEKFTVHYQTSKDGLDAELAAKEIARVQTALRKR